MCRLISSVDKTTYKSFWARWIQTSVTLGSDGMNQADKISFQSIDLIHILQYSTDNILFAINLPCARRMPSWLLCRIAMATKASPAARNSRRRTKKPKVASDKRLLAQALK
jgi:hypothetical protein